MTAGKTANHSSFASGEEEGRHAKGMMTKQRVESHSHGTSFAEPGFEIEYIMIFQE
jgi:hypothetical protein